MNMIVDRKTVEPWRRKQSGILYEKSKTAFREKLKIDNDYWYSQLDKLPGILDKNKGHNRSKEQIKDELQRLIKSERNRVITEDGGKMAVLNRTIGLIH